MIGYYAWICLVLTKYFCKPPGPLPPTPPQSHKSSYPTTVLGWTRQDHCQAGSTYSTIYSPNSHDKCLFSSAFVIWRSNLLIGIGKVELILQNVKSSLPPLSLSTLILLLTMNVPVLTPPIYIFL